MTNDTYTLRLLSLRCIECQEDYGDEVFITLNGKKVWDCRVVGYKMHDSPNKDKKWMDQYNFPDLAYQTEPGRRQEWYRNNAYSADQFVFQLDAPAELVIHECDWEIDFGEVSARNRLTQPTDILANIFVNANNPGEHTSTFKWAKAKYRITYAIDT